MAAGVFGAGVLGEPVHDRVAAVREDHEQSACAVVRCAPQRLDPVEGRSVADDRDDRAPGQCHPQSGRRREREPEPAHRGAQQAERLARRLFARGLAHTVLVVPIAQERATMHLDTIATMVDVDALVMYPAVADHLQALGEQGGIVLQRAHHLDRTADRLRLRRADRNAWNGGSGGRRTGGRAG